MHGRFKPLKSRKNGIRASTMFSIYYCIGSSGTFAYYFTSGEIWEQNTKKYILHVKAFDRNTNEIVTLNGSFRVFGHQEKYFCTQNMINTATSPIQQGGVVEFISVGRVANFKCTIDGYIIIPCKFEQ